MYIAFVIVTVLTAAALVFSATADFIRYDKVLTNMARAGVPESWLTTLATLKTAGAVGLVVGLGVPTIGAAAAIGVVCFFIGAIVTQIRAGWYSFSYPAVYLALAVCSLGLGLAAS